MGGHKVRIMIKLTRRVALAALLALPTPLWAQGPTSALSPEDQALVDKAVAYLEGMNQVKGRFDQTDAKGRNATGDFFLKRPGKLRLAYDAPNSLIVVSDGALVSVLDTRLQTFEQYPLNFSPLSLFLAKNIRLDKGVKVTKVDRTPDGFSITARDGARKTAGQITLAFSDKPMALREWTVVDAQSGTTRVLLSDLTPASLDNSLFVLKDPRPKRGGGPHG
jgi:outer membrane lipoprotein-sorting protein